MMAIETLSLAQLIDMQLKEVIDIKAKAIINSFIIKQEPSDSVTVEEPMKEEADNRLTECETLIQSNKLAEASEILKEDETTGLFFNCLNKPATFKLQSFQLSDGT